MRRFPGPKLSAISYIPYGRLYLSGEAHKGILKLHQTYGPIVRVAPHILSVNHPNGMKELRGHRKTGTGENGKDPVQFQANSTNIIGANREDHQRFRRALAHGFSSQAMLDQQPIIRIRIQIDRIYARKFLSNMRDATIIDNGSQLRYLFRGLSALLQYSCLLIYFVLAVT